jgi:hypothetical protein
MGKDFDKITIKKTPTDQSGLVWFGAVLDQSGFFPSRKVLMVLI